MAVAGGLLDPDEPAPVAVCNPGGRSPFLLVGDHAGNAIPRALGTLGLSEPDRVRHIAWDIGVQGLGVTLAAALDAPFIYQHYSRLVIDCNRDPWSDEAVLDQSDGSLVPGNRGLSVSDRDRRIAAIHAPYHDRIAVELGTRRQTGPVAVVVALHSFTPAMGGHSRPWHVGVLYDQGDVGFAMAVLAELARDPALCVGDNEPYRMDATDHTINRHAVPAGLPYVELEIRQDLIATEQGRKLWCARLSDVLSTALRKAGLA